MFQIKAKKKGDLNKSPLTISLDQTIFSASFQSLLLFPLRPS
jgi:hypothetical protein